MPHDGSFHQSAGAFWTRRPFVIAGGSGWGVWLVALATILSAAGRATAMPSGFALEGRAIPVRWSAAASQAAAGSVSGLQETQVKVSFVLSASESQKDYALRWQSPASCKPGELWINGRRWEGHPVAGADGDYYLVGSPLLRPGANQIVGVAVPGASATPGAIEMVSLRTGAEAAHFHRLFGRSRILAQPPSDPEQAKFDALHYDLSLRLNMTQPVVDGVLTLTALSLDASLTTVVLDLNDNAGQMGVTAVDDGAPAPGAFSYLLDAAKDRLFVTLPAAQAPGTTFTVRVTYKGRPGYGLFGPSYGVSTHGGGVPIISTLSEPYGARNWWPCKDTPDDKATMRMALRCPAGYTALSNGILTGVTDHGDGSITWEWNETYPMSTYLASIACTNYVAASAAYTARDGRTTMTEVLAQSLNCGSIEVALRLGAQHLAAPAVQVADDVAHVLLGDRHGDGHDRLEEHGFAHLEGLLEADVRRDLERHLRRVHVVIRAVVELHLDVDDGIAGEQALRQELADALLHRGDEVPRDDAADDRVLELEAPPARQR